MPDTFNGLNELYKFNELNKILFQTPIKFNLTNNAFFNHNFSSQVWEDNWDDDKIEDDFSKQLKEELEKKSMN